MKTLKLIYIAWKALRLNKTRSFLTMLGIIIGVASVVTMMAIGEGSKQSIKAEISSMGTNMITVRPGADMMGGVRMDPGASQTLTGSDLEALKKQASLISNISPQVNGNGQAIYQAKNWPTSILGVSPEYLDVRVLAVKSGSMFTASDVALSSKVVVLGQTVVDELFSQGEDPVGKTVRFNRIPFKVIGVLQEKGENTFGQDQDDIILAPYTSVQKRILASTHLQSIVASAISEDQAAAAVTQVSKILRISHKLRTADEDDFSVFSQEELISTLTSTTRLLTYLLVAIAGISLLVGGIGIMNIMYVSVKERTREIGLRMAVGGKGFDILMHFLTEAIMISVTGGIIGVLISIVATSMIAAFFNWPVSITFYSITVAFAVCVVTGVFFGWYPARKASEMDPIAALRYE
jgi:putative ABC transport system permease protein